MKILVVSNMYPNKKFPSYGVFVKNFCKQLDLLNLEYEKCVIYNSKSKLTKMIKYFCFLMNVMKKLIFKKYDLVYIHYASHSSVPVLIISKIKKLRIYTNVHGSDVVPENSKHEFMQRNTRKILRISKKIIVPSEYFKGVVEEKYAINSNRIFVSPSGGVDENIFYCERKKNNGTTIKLGYVGRISCNKGWETLLVACSYLQFPFELTIVGNGPDYPKLLRFIESSSLSEKIKLIDFLPQKELREVYNDIDAFVFPTYGESLGLVAIEAMACGTPVIASDIAAPSFLVVDNYNGLKCICGDSLDLAKKIEAFYNMDNKEKSKLAAGAIETAKMFKTDILLESMRSILEE